VDRNEAITRLPDGYQRALLLVAIGRDDEEIARHLGIETQAVRSLVSLAEAKLARLTGAPAVDDLNGGEEEP
jgi:DNA-directed RNA polymerase specialized sigma24 family protein